MSIFGYPKLWELKEDDLFRLTKSLPFIVTVLTTKTGKEKNVEIRQLKSPSGLYINYRGSTYLSIFREREYQIELAKKFDKWN